ncbi:MAG: hypothetical protein AAFZ52_10970 [Bacteroidota bacterium]
MTGWMLLGAGLFAQGAVSFLKADAVNHREASPAAELLAEQAFTFARNLIFFSAQLDGTTGSFILDTGAPRLLVNNRGVATGTRTATGIASSGEVALHNHRVESFQMGGQEHGKRWALALDLRALEKRMERPVDGFVGHELLRGGELRIDYPNRTFQLRKSVRQPQHAGRQPDLMFRFDYSDHLPVITLKVGKHKLRLALDTGAGVNLIDARYAELFLDTGEKMNLQGLDGNNGNYSILRPGTTPSTIDRHELTFVALPLDRLQTPGKPRIDGLLGSAFLANYCVGIDYRRRKLYLWQTAPDH